MPIVEAIDASLKSFDYVIIGGGTAGLTLAVRLSEIPSVKVLVLEAGKKNFDDPIILTPGRSPQALGDSKYDWNFMTTKQERLNDRELPFNRGKGLGGSSALNFYVWMNPPAADIDAFEALGNPGWNWVEFKKYSEKVESFHVPAKEQTDFYPYTYDLNFRGTSGPIQVTIPPHYHTVDALVNESLVNKGLKATKDPHGGDNTGAWIATCNIDPTDWTRSYTVNAYLQPNLARPNLTVVVEALVSRIVFTDTVGQDLTACGVELIHNDHVYTIRANKEVILCAGAIMDPQVLELSGIGRPEILSKIGVDVKLELPGVGENVQEHPHFPMTFELDAKTSHETFDLMSNPDYVQEAIKLYDEGKGPFRSHGIVALSYFSLALANPAQVDAIIDKLEVEINIQEKDGVLPPGLLEQFRHQISVLRNENLPDLQLIGLPRFSPIKTNLKPEPGKRYVSFSPLLNHPFSRGTIHASTKNPKDYPEINPHYFENDFDLEIMVQQFKFIRSLSEVEPWKSNVVRETNPGPQCESDQDIRDYIKNTLTTTWHTIGSCSMLPRDKNGVVDARLKVYGTTNLRIVDVSIIPLHIASHTQTAAYVIGEKAADLIKSDHGLKV